MEPSSTQLPSDTEFVFNDSPYNGGTPEAQERILVHELAHFVHATGFDPNFRTSQQATQAQKNNDQLVQTIARPW